MSKPKVFISYCHADEEPWKNRLQKHLEVLDRRGSLSFWEDRQIAVGTEWRAEINEALASAEAAILLISVDFLRSKFIRDEEVPVILQRRMQEGMKVFPLLLRSCPWQKEEWLSRLQVRPTDGKPLAQYDKDDDIDRVLTEFASEIETLLNHRPAPIIAAASTNQECPYLGLEAFTEDKRHLFFGRDNFIEAIWQKLHVRQFVAVVGPSGSGKSSVIQAGVFPRLGGEWHKLVFQPGDDPFLNLADKFVELRGARYRRFSERSKAVEAVAQQIRGSRSIAAMVAETLAALPQPSRLLLVADQFEELFTLTPTADRQPFIESLLAASHLEELKVLVTLRADFFGQAISLTPELSQLIQDGVVTHRPLQRADWEAVILQPAKTVGLHVEPALVALILEEIEAQPDSLPLLEYALKELWELREQGRIGLAQYEAIGKLAGAINQRADAVLAQLPAEQQPLALRALTRLVRVSGGEEEGADTRLRLPLNELTAEQREVLQRFIDERLLVTNRLDRTSEETIEVAHEALIRQWEKLREALDSDREFLVWRRRLNMRRSLWEQKGRDDKWLLFGGDHDEARRWLNERETELRSAEYEFITWVDRSDFQIEQILRKGPELCLFSEGQTRDDWLTTLVFCEKQDLAITIANSHSDPAEHHEILNTIAKALMRLGEYAKAQLLMENAWADILTIDDKYSFREALCLHLENLLLGEMTSDANKVANFILDELAHPTGRLDRVMDLYQIGDSLIKAGVLPSVLNEISHIEDFHRVIFIGSGIAKSLIVKGSITDAVNFVFHLTPVSGGYEVLENVIRDLFAEWRILEIDKLISTVNEQLAINPENESKIQIEELAGNTLEKIVALRSEFSSQEMYSEDDDDLDVNGLCFLATKNEKEGNISKFQEFIIRALENAENSDEYEDIERGIAKAAATLSGRTVDEVLETTNALDLSENRVALLGNIADLWVNDEKNEQAKTLSFYMAEEIEYIFEDIPHSTVSSSLSCLLSRLHEYKAAREVADNCKLSLDRLAAYTAILREYHIERNPSLARLFAEEAAEALRTQVAI